MVMVGGLNNLRRVAAALCGASLMAIMAPGGANAADALYADMKGASFGSTDCDFFCRFYKAYADEWGKSAPPADPTAPAVVSHRPLPFPPAPVTQPPFPFTEWPYGGSQTIGASVPNAVDSPLMTALAPTDLGKWMNEKHIQMYGWINVGGNLSTASVAKDGNFPAAYMYKPNTVTLDQAVIYIERVPDTVQQNHVDWGFRISALYGENYRYTTAYDVASYQLLQHNFENGYDFPMVYGEIYIPGVAEGLLVRFGRYISVPDIEAQLAPNNYMYSHSMTYGYDNYTNTGIIGTLQATKNWLVQLGLAAGTETVPWNSKDPGTQPTLTACARWSSDNSWHNVNVCANGLNTGEWGYNNLQWYGFTTYHKLSDNWHIAIEFWDMHQNNVAAFGSTNLGTFGTPGGQNFLSNPIAQPFTAHCKPGQLSCTAEEASALIYINYSLGDLDNLTGRAELFNDMNGQRTGYKTMYDNFALGWQHWLSPSIYIRPEIAWYQTTDGQNAFNRNPVTGVGNENHIAIFSVDTIIRF